MNIPGKGSRVCLLWMLVTINRAVVQSESTCRRAVARPVWVHHTGCISTSNPYSSGMPLTQHGGGAMEQRRGQGIGSRALWLDRLSDKWKGQSTNGADLDVLTPFGGETWFTASSSRIRRTGEPLYYDIGYIIIPIATIHPMESLQISTPKNGSKWGLILIFRPLIYQKASESAVKHFQQTIYRKSKPDLPLSSGGQAAAFQSRLLHSRRAFNTRTTFKAHMHWICSLE